MPNNYTLIIPNPISSVFRKATIPDFPSLLMKMPKDIILYCDYSGCDFKVSVELLERDFRKHRLNFSDIKNFDTRFQHAIGSWLISRQAKQTSREVDGNIKDLANDILGWKQTLRKSDYQKIEINLKSLGTLFYIVTFKKPERTYEFKLIRQLIYDFYDGDFKCVLDDCIRQVVPEKYSIKKEPFLTYTSKQLKDIYPKQSRYKFNMRQYLTGIKNNKKDIPQTRGEYLLDQFGYWADCSLGKKKYRNAQAQKLINEYIKLAKTYGLQVSVTERFKDSKTVSKKYYHTMVKRTHEREKIPVEEQEKLITELTRLIQLEPGCDHAEISRNKAVGLTKEYGFSSIKRAFDSDPIATIDDLIMVLEAGCEN